MRSLSILFVAFFAHTAKAARAEARRSRVAFAVATSNKSIAANAREENISRSHASILANSPRSRIEIAETLNRFCGQAKALVKTALDAIQESFKAEKQVVVHHTERRVRRTKGKWRRGPTR
jgi:hypothetical protein